MVNNCGLGMAYLFTSLFILVSLVILSNYGNNRVLQLTASILQLYNTDNCTFTVIITRFLGTQ